jgi:glucose/arabinose dehydrogenase
MVSRGSATLVSVAVFVVLVAAPLAAPVHVPMPDPGSLPATWAAEPVADLSLLRLVPYASGFASPVAFVQDPADPGTQFVVEQAGRIRTLVSGALQPTDFLDLRGRIAAGGERGLLGLAFPADTAETGRFYVNFTDPGGNTVVARFRRSADPRVADPDSRFDLRWSTGLRVIQQPYANHNGGCLQFGSDGYLFIGMGDGGSGNDPEHRAQNPASLLGKMLRIDVGVPDDNVDGFRIPPDNPFVGSPLAGVRPEIWAFGLRNPWRFSFDDVAHGGTGALIIEDVGQVSWAEIDYEPRGAGGRNYGWRNREGANANVTSLPPAFVPLTEPVHQYSHAVGHSITGGYVYRGRNVLGISGRYFFGDYVNARVWSAAVAVDPVTGEASMSDVIDHTDTLQSNVGTGNISAFGVDSNGELFVVDYTRGAVLRLTQQPSVPSNVRITQ